MIYLYDIDNVADVYDEGTLTDLFIEGADTWISNNLSHCWAQNAQLDSKDNALQSKSVFSTQDGVNIASGNDQVKFR